MKTASPFQQDPRSSKTGHADPPTGPKAADASGHMVADDAPGVIGSDDAPGVIGSDDASGDIASDESRARGVLDEAPGDVGEYVRALKASDLLGSRVTAHALLPEKAPCFAATARPWPKAVRGVLEQMGIERLYSHQAEAADYLRAGKSVIAATPTASGKSLIYALPVLEQFLRDPEARSIFLFPLKALARDQLAAFEAMTAHWPKEARPEAAVYDGDTTAHFRAKIRARPPQVLLTNPEMLHLSLLPHHQLWAGLFAGLHLVVVDEVHTYRGVLGSHMAQVFRRLKRVAALYGSAPVFAFCSATVGNPAELANLLTGDQPAPVLESGAPQGKRHYLFINPEGSPATAAIKLLKSALARRLRTIVYCRSRRMTELVSLWAAEKAGPFAKRISAYRAGFLPEERREIEARMASGELLAVISTSALELGIDIGSLDLCILVGYPGTVMATLQRGGRVGRLCRESAVILLAGEDALDQYIVRHAADFFSRPPEKAVLNPDNPVILDRHLECAAAELPLRPGRHPDAAWMDKEVMASAKQLEQRGLLLRSADGAQLLAARKRPQRHISLRGSGGTVSIESAKGELIGSVDGVRAMREAHPGAIYLHLGRHFEITELDLGAGRALARPFRPAWYTRSRGHKDTQILSLDAARRIAGIALQRGRLRITDFVTGYEKRASANGCLLGVTPLDMPPTVFESEGLWFQVPPGAQAKIEAARMHFMGSIHALEHAAIGILPLLVMADRNDFGGISTPMHAQTGRASVFIYDGLPGGAGLTRAAFDLAADFFAHVRSVMADCACELGCPSCVHSPKCGSGNRPIDKEGALALLDAMLEDSESNRREAEAILADPPDLAEAPGADEEARRDAQSLKKRDYRVILPGADDLRQDEAKNKNRVEAAALAADKPLPDRQNGRGQAETDKPLPDRTNDLGEGQAKQGSRVKAREPVPGSRQEPLFIDQPSAGLDFSGHFVVLDVETRLSAKEVGGWHRADRMGVSVAVIYDSRSGIFSAYTQDELPDMARLLASAPLVVGFNLLRFDYKVLAPHAPELDFGALPTLDMLQKVREKLSYPVSLDNLAGATLNSKKSADGLMALKWWQEQRLDAIEEYCRKDVALTRDLFLYGREHGFLLFTNKAGQSVRVPADWQRP